MWMEEAHVQPTVTSYCSVIKACAEKGSVKKAEQWFVWMEEMGVQPNVASYNSVINACAQIGDVKRAEQWFKDYHDYLNEGINFIECANLLVLPDWAIFEKFVSSETAHLSDPWHSRCSVRFRSAA